MSYKRECFTNFRKLYQPRSIKIGDGTYVEALGIGEINVLAFDGKDWNSKHLVDVLYVPEIKYNLFSEGATVDESYKIVTDQRGCRITKQGRTLAVGVRRNKLFEMQFKVVQQKPSQANIAIPDNLETWQRKLVHQNYRQVKQILNQHDILV